MYSVFDLQSWNMLRGTNIYILFWVFWRIKHWNQLRNGQVSKIDLQIDLDHLAAVFDLWSWNMLRGTHIYILFRVFWRIKGWNQLSLTSDPEKCAEEPTFIFDSEHFDVLNVEIG